MILGSIASSDFDWRSGRVSHWDLENLDAETLREDLALIEFPNAVVLDIGWYADAFMIMIVRDDWERPHFRLRVPSVADLAREIPAAIVIASELSAAPSE